ncbi:hypothetical protein CLLI_15780 [Clostridium liquoris]|jgi:4-hydroxybutyrate CoA-transferase|uniref:CGGC domain protein n=1 Tax=Clostridium liquoris TaxID=1289519 RepID=A0A2T0B3K8_9CLOT|nr:hypothetical protein [Clostridium liquoris]PRR78494.1 hypothetical protein CLLI_15780 [Clostridium liquoris]
MIIGIKYCGGCNPKYDRGNIVTKLISEFKDLTVELAKEGKTYDLIVVLCGCTSCCANHQNLHGKYGKVFILSDKDYSIISNAINNIMLQK